MESVFAFEMLIEQVDDPLRVDRKQDITAHIQSLGDHERDRMPSRLIDHL